MTMNIYADGDPRSTAGELQLTGSTDDGPHEKARSNGIKLLPSPSQPMKVARVFVNEHFIHDGALKLYHWRGGWWWWRTSHWYEVEDRAVRTVLYWFTEHAVYLDDGVPTPWAPNSNKIANLVDALKSVCFLSGQFDQPSWLEERGSKGTIVSFNNGLLNIEQRRLLEHTPRFFNQTAVPFDYDPAAPPPQRWLAFLNELWPNDQASIDALGEWFGYIISGRLDQHKILLMVGPTRGGKGVIARTLTSLIGRQNVAGPTLHSLGGEFGLQPLIGKPLAVISDARFADKNGTIVIERLLSISGEDTLTINRKYKDQWTGKLPTRLLVISNEFPKLGDASTAIIGRIVLLPLSNSWLGKEDHRLEQTLQGELSGILNWALAGLQRLTMEDGFTRVSAAEEAINMMRDLASPIGAFVAECCVLGPKNEIIIDALYGAYRTWCDDSGHAKSTKPVFGRDLRAAIPSIRIRRPRYAGDRQRVYQGIALKV
jgi:putative DNA primase/helicase